MIPGLGKSLEEEMAMANHFSILSLKIPWIEETWPATVSLWGCKTLGQDGETKPPPQYTGLAKKVHLGFSAPSTEKPKHSFWPTQYSPWYPGYTALAPQEASGGSEHTVSEQDGKWRERKVCKREHRTATHQPHTSPDP